MRAVHKMIMMMREEYKESELKPSEGTINPKGHPSPAAF